MEQSCAHVIMSHYGEDFIYLLKGMAFYSTHVTHTPSLKEYVSLSSSLVTQICKTKTMAGEIM